MISGPRAGQTSALRRWLAGLAGQALDAFVVPGPEILDAQALDPVAAGLRLVPNPRHASVLVLVGEVPPGLAHAAAVAYSQQPRPRAILSIGAPSAAPLPSADVVVMASQSALDEGVTDLRRRLALGAWDPDPPPFLINESQTAEPASANDDEPHGHHAMSHGSDDMADMQMLAMEHMHMGGRFMSMVMMTRHLPRSADGLPMEWLEVPFGLLFPGLPGGLNLVLTLDGDTIARAEVRGGIVRRNVAAVWPGPAETFARPTRATRSTVQQCLPRSCLSCSRASHRR